VVLVALFLFALIEREARREVAQSGQVFAGLRAEGRDQLLAAFAPLSLVKQRLRVAGELVDVRTPTTLTPIQAQILRRLQLPPPTAYVQPSITPYPPEQWLIQMEKLDLALNFFAGGRHAFSQMPTGTPWRSSAHVRLAKTALTIDWIPTKSNMLGRRHATH
jgi:hypothetical protein